MVEIRVSNEVSRIRDIVNIDLAKVKDTQQKGSRGYFFSMVYHKENGAGVRNAHKCIYHIHNGIECI